MNYSWHCFATLSTCFGALLWAVDPDISPILPFLPSWCCQNATSDSLTLTFCASPKSIQDSVLIAWWNTVNWQHSDTIIDKKCAKNAHSLDWRGCFIRGFCSEFIMHLSNRNFRFFRNFRTTRSSVNLIWCYLYCSSLNSRVWKCRMAGWVFRVLMESCHKIKLITKSGTIRSISWISSIFNKIYVEWFPKETLWFFHYLIFTKCMFYMQHNH